VWQRRPPRHRRDPIAATLVRKRAIIDRLELDFAYEAARFAREYDENLFANPSPYSWMRENCHMAGGAAVNAVRVGDYAARLALSVTALTAQHIGFAHLSLIASTAAAVGDSPAALARFDEQRLLSKARTVPLRRFRIECAHVRHAADREAFLAAQVEDRQWSSLRVRTLTGGGLEVTGYIDAEGGAVVRTALEPLAGRRGRDDDRCRERRLACDATITRVLLDPRTATVDVGPSERVVTGATRRALNVRDKGCRWPGCDRSVVDGSAPPAPLGQRRCDGPGKPRSPLQSPPLGGA
jgi:hypothetical protein